MSCPLFNLSRNSESRPKMDKSTSSASVDVVSWFFFETKPEINKHPARSDSDSLSI